MGPDRGKSVAAERFVRQTVDARVATGRFQLGIDSMFDVELGATSLRDRSS